MDVLGIRLPWTTLDSCPGSYNITPAGGLSIIHEMTEGCTSNYKIVKTDTVTDLDVGEQSNNIIIKLHNMSSTYA